MSIIEYPKALYRAGEPVVVADAQGEALALADGFVDWTTDHARTEGAGDSVSAPEKAEDAPRTRRASPRKVAP